MPWGGHALSLYIEHLLRRRHGDQEERKLLESRSRKASIFSNGGQQAACVKGVEL